MPTAAGTDVGANAAASQANGGAASAASSQNNMSMAGSAGGNVPSMNVTAYIVDTPKQAEVRYNGYADADKQTG